MYNMKKEINCCPSCGCNWLHCPYSFDKSQYVIRCTQCKIELSMVEYELKGSKCNTKNCNEVGITWNDLNTLFSSDLSPYCSNHHQDQLNYLNRRCGICGSAIKSCCC